VILFEYRLEAIEYDKFYHAQSIEKLYNSSRKKFPVTGRSQASIYAQFLRERSGPGMEVVCTLLRYYLVLSSNIADIERGHSTTHFLWTPLRNRLKISKIDDYSHIRGSDSLPVMSKVTKRFRQLETDSRARNLPNPPEILDSENEDSDAGNSDDESDASDDELDNNGAARPAENFEDLLPENEEKQDEKNSEE